MNDNSRHHALNGRNVLITGGLGFIGSNLAKAIVEVGNVRVTILDALVPGQGGKLFNVSGILDKIDVRIGDMGDESTIVPLVSGVDYIFNLVGSAGHVDAMADPRRDIDFNCSAQLTLLEACRNYNPQAKIVYASTRQVYGKPQYLPVDEQHRVAPIDVNGAHKFAAENYHQIYNRVHGLRTVCLRLTNTYGPRQLLHHDRQGFIPWFIRKAMEGDTIHLFGGGKQRRDLNYVDDVVDAMLLAAINEVADGDVFNLGAENVVSLEQLALELIDITGRGQVESVPFPADRHGIEIGNIFSNFEKISSVLGWKPQIGLRTGLTRTVEFYLQNREHYWNGPTIPVSRSLKAA
jgi:UDP-glucose 4-epimerase